MKQTPEDVEAYNVCQSNDDKYDAKDKGNDSQGIRQAGGQVDFHLVFLLETITKRPRAPTFRLL